MKQAGQPLRNRLFGLDVLRGTAIVLMFLVTKRTPVAQLRHVDWFGATVADLVYPLFLILTGVSWNLSTRGSADGRSSDARRVLVRLFRLFLIGCALTSLSKRAIRIDLATLQCIALASLIAFPWRCSTWKRQTAVAFTLCFGVAALNFMFRTAEENPVPSPWHEGFTLSERVDLLLLGGTRGPEGILSTVSAAAFVLIGLAAGGALAKATATAANPPRRITSAILHQLFTAGLALVTIGAVSAYFIPISPQLMTPPFVLVAAGISLLTLVAALAWSDGLDRRGGLAPLAIYGQNPLAAFVFVRVVQRLILEPKVFPPIGGSASGRESLDPALISLEAALKIIATPWFDPNWVVPIIKVAVGYVFCWILWRRGIHLKV